MPDRPSKKQQPPQAKSKSKSKTTKKPAPNPLDIHLARLPADAGQKLPDMPVKTAILEAQRMVKPAQKLRPELVDLNDFDLTNVDDLPLLATALRVAEAAWQKARAGQQKVSLTKARADAEELRRKFFKSARYRLRRNPEALAEIDRIAEGDDLADLISDLGDIDEFLRAHAAAFRGDKVLPKDAIAKARALADTLSGGTDSSAALDAQSHRNRVFYALQAAVGEVRAAARYLIDDPRTLLPFLSQYNNDRARRYRKNQDAKAPPSTNPPTDGSTGAKAPVAAAPARRKRGR